MRWSGSSNRAEGSTSHNRGRVLVSTRFCWNCPVDTTMNSATVFLDTNIFLHFQPFDQIRWAKELRCERVILILSQMVVHELDRLKDEHSNDRIRNRARTNLSKLHDIIDAGGTIEPHVELRFEEVPPMVSYIDLGLDRSRNDDQLIASVYAYRTLHEDERIVIITNDTGLRLKCRIRQIECVKLREELSLKNETDPQRQRLKDLEAENAALRQSKPNLDLTFRGGGNCISFAIQPELPASLTEARAWLETEVIPRVQQPSPIPASTLAKLEGTGPDLDITNWYQVFAALAVGVNEHRLQSIQQFYSECIRYHGEWREHQNAERRTCRLPLIVTNSGSLVAEDVYVLFKMPTTVQVFPTGRTPGAPKPPEPSGVTLVQSSAKHQPVHEAVLQRPVTAKLISNVVVGSYRELCYHIPKVQHHVGEWLPPIALRFYSHLAATTIVIPYQITASNTTVPTQGELTVEVPSSKRRSLARRRK